MRRGRSSRRAARRARLDEGYVDVCVGEREQRRSGQHLELGCVLDPCLAHARNHRVEIGLLLGDANPLRPADDVRREVGADTQSLRGKQRLDHPHGCRLAVRATWMAG